MPNKKRQTKNSTDLLTERQETTSLSNLEQCTKLNQLLEKFTKRFNNSKPENLELWKNITPENILIYTLIYSWYESSGRILLSTPTLLKDFHAAYVESMKKKNYPFVGNVTFLRYLRSIVSAAVIVKRHCIGTQLILKKPVYLDDQFFHNFNQTSQKDVIKLKEKKRTSIISEVQPLLVPLLENQLFLDIQLLSKEINHSEEETLRQEAIKDWQSIFFYVLTLVQKEQVLLEDQLLLSNIPDSEKKVIKTELQNNAEFIPKLQDEMKSRDITLPKLVTLQILSEKYEVEKIISSLKCLYDFTFDRVNFFQKYSQKEKILASLTVLHDFTSPPNEDSLGWYVQRLESATEYQARETSNCYRKLIISNEVVPSQKEVLQKKIDTNSDFLEKLRKIKYKANKL